MYLTKLIPNTVLIPTALRDRLDPLSIVEYVGAYNDHTSIYNILGLDEASSEEREESSHQRLMQLAERQGLPMILIPDRLSQSILIFKFEVSNNSNAINQVVGLSMSIAIENRCNGLVLYDHEAERALKYWFDNMPTNIRLGKAHSLKAFLE